MCEVFSIVTEKDCKLGSALIEAGRRFSYRGYISVGGAALSQGGVDVCKDVEEIEEVNVLGELLPLWDHSQGAPYFLDTIRDGGPLFLLSSGRILNAFLLGAYYFPGSTLATFTEHSLPLACGYEIGTPSAWTFSNETFLSLYLAHRLAGESAKCLERLPNLLELTLEKTASQSERPAESSVQCGDLYYLSYGITDPIAQEGALTLQKISNNHCEVFSALNTGTGFCLQSAKASRSLRQGSQ
ncbi:MAG: hypothetical protein QW334_00975 [Thermofilum sp.]